MTVDAEIIQFTNWIMEVIWKRNWERDAIWDVQDIDVRNLQVTPLIFSK